MHNEIKPLGCRRGGFAEFVHFFCDLAHLQAGQSLIQLLHHAIGPGSQFNGRPCRSGDSRNAQNHLLLGRVQFLKSGKHVVEYFQRTGRRRNEILPQGCRRLL